MPEERLQALGAAVAGAAQVLILPHNDPDPDAIAGAVALQYLLKQQWRLESQIAYRGIIGRAENRALVRYLNYPLQPLPEEMLAQATHIAMVDTQPGAGNNPWATGQKVAVVIDHHPPRPATAAVTFADVRPDIGSTSTLVLEYLQVAKCDLPASLTTALFYGIKTDTRGLSRGVSPADIVAYFHLQAGIDIEALAEIERAQVPTAYFKSFALAIETTRLYRDVAISYVGAMDYPDLAAEMADLLSRLEAVGWVICLGTYQNTLILAVRAPGRQGGAGQLVQAMVGPEGTAGGHGAMAGGQISLKGTPPDLLVKELIRRALQHLKIDPGTVPCPLV